MKIKSFGTVTIILNRIGDFINNNIFCDLFCEIRFNYNIDKGVFSTCFRNSFSPTILFKIILSRSFLYLVFLTLYNNGQ